MRGGISFPQWPRFRRPPYNPGRPDFPGAVGNLGLSSVSLSIGGEVQALVRIRPVFRGLHTASFHHMRRLIASSVSGLALASETAKHPESLHPMPVLPPFEGRRV